jgi:hypothetical protein
MKIGELSPIFERMFSVMQCEPACHCWNIRNYVCNERSGSHPQAGPGQFAQHIVV